MAVRHFSLFSVRTDWAAAITRRATMKWQWRGEGCSVTVARHKSGEKEDAEREWRIARHRGAASPQSSSRKCAIYIAAHTYGNSTRRKSWAIRALLALHRGTSTPCRTHKGRAGDGQRLQYQVLNNPLHVCISSIISA